MSESRIQDWIRYVQERAENVPDAPPAPPAADSEPAPAVEVAPIETASLNAATNAATLPVAADSPLATGPALLDRPALVPRARGGTPETAVKAPPQRIRRPAPNGPIARRPADARHLDKEGAPQSRDTRRPEADAPKTAALEETVRQDGAARRTAAERTAETRESARLVRRRQRQRPETRAQMLERLTNPTISLHEAGVLLGVCSATVRRYTNSGLLPHARTEGGQRRFRLHDVLLLLHDMESKRK